MIDFIKNKEELLNHIGNLNTGDIIYVSNVECLGSSIYDITNTLKIIRDKKLKLNISNELEFNFNAEKDILDKVILLLDGICNIQKERLSKSIKRAVEEGRNVGRKKLQVSNIPKIFFDNIDDFKEKKINKREFSEICGCTRPTLNNWLKISSNE